MNPLPPECPTLAAVALPRWRASRGPGGAFQWAEAVDCVAAEAPLTLRVEGRAVAVVMRTPGHDRELAAGFLLTEGVIGSAGDLFEISLCPSLERPPGAAPDTLAGESGEAMSGETGDSAHILLTDPSGFDPGRLTRHVFTSSSCGICSKTDLTTALRPEQILRPGAKPLVSAATLATFPDRLRAAQPTFAATGGLHACAWFSLEDLAAPPLLFEDVGRHNALDKLLGHALLAGQSLSAGLLLLSGRISFELVQKALAARLPLIAAVGAPSSLAVAYAAAAGITLCGFVRDDRLNVYTHPGRVR